MLAIQNTIEKHLFTYTAFFSLVSFANLLLFYPYNEKDQSLSSIAEGSLLLEPWQPLWLAVCSSWPE